MSEDERFDAVILGAGISGLVAASILSEEGKRVCVADNYHCLGGNHIDVAIGPYTFDIGSLIFQDDSPLIKHFPELLPFYVHVKPTWSRLNPQRRVTAYPVSIKDDIVAAGPLEWMRIGCSLLWARAVHRRIGNAYEFARYWIGARFLKRSGLENYMARFYGLPPRRIDYKFAESRMLWIKEHSSLRKYVPRRTKPTPSGPPNRQLVRPREGFASLYQATKQKLEQRGVVFILGAGISGIDKTARGFDVHTSTRCLRAGRVVSTLPLHDALGLCRLSTVSSLQTVTLISLFYSFTGKRGFGSSILYNFSDQGSWKRLTVYSDFYGRVGGDREFFAVEVNADLVGFDVQTAHREFRQHTQDNHLFDGDLVLEGSHQLENAYPVYSDGADALAKQSIAALKEFGIDSIGRQGRFDYQPTARDSTIKAERALAE